jgi:hypothetical protein
MNTIEILRVSPRQRPAAVLLAALVAGMLLCSGWVRAFAGEQPAVFLDNSPGVENGSSRYDPNTRRCGGGSCRVFTRLDEAAAALADSDVLYIRRGTYCRPSVGKYIEVHGHKVNYWTGALALTASGRAGKRKLVAAYEDELVIIQAKPGRSEYNPDPGDLKFGKSSHFYPNPAVSIGGDYIDVRGLKTFGQVVIAGQNVSVQDCDLGGGGPHMNQGQVIAINGGNRRGGSYGILIRNNRIHHSCWGESHGNGAALMCYDASFIAEHNEFTDNWGDLGVKDTGQQAGREVVIRYNFFGPSSINLTASFGFHGPNQDRQVDRILIHNNIFLRKAVGVSFRMPARLEPIRAYQNTFVDCGFGNAEVGDMGDWINTEARLWRNLFYHSKAKQRFYSVQTDPWEKLQSDHNLFFSATGDTAWWHKYRQRATTLAQWREYSGRDRNSVWRDPGFVKPEGSRPADFKRREARPSDVPGQDGERTCGAYVTGDEAVGLLPGTRPRR